MKDPSTTILSSDSEDLREARDTELRRVLKLKLVLAELRRLNLGRDQSLQTKNVLKLVSIGDYMRLGENDGGQEHVLGLQDASSFPPLSYVDRKTVRDKLFTRLRGTLQAVAELGDKMREEFPDDFARETELSADQKEILQLEEEHRRGLEQLVELVWRKCSMLRDAAELKLGPQLANELKLKQAEMQLVQAKAELLRCVIANEAVSRTEHSFKAHKEVEAYLDELLAAKNAPTKK
ncbi:augmin complex subunit dgt2 [Drosophila kikkawai]|uniref:Augmin complex subunit dgt2 n=1 Tax=Drosophila kikkawai TaxID=30033 RepID=A0A6P4ILI0_DROKI|nr:augmin complex subunit dgt2 [Drosophila kikkawai]